MSISIPAASTARLRPTGRQRTGTGVRGRIFLGVVCLLLALAVPSDGYLGSERMTLALNRAIGSQGFRLAAWEAQALSEMARDMIARPEAELTETARHSLVVAYFDAIRQIDSLERDIQRIYADPQETEPKAAAAPLQRKLEDLRAAQARRRPAVQRILEQQTAAVLEDAGLTTAGRVLPPVRFLFSESPNYLIVSPRDRIAFMRGIYLKPAVAVARQEEIEAQVEGDLDVSALVEGTGGFSSYPTTVFEYTNLEWVLSTIAHEWVHTYLFFRPLGWHYYDDSDTRTLNETTASIVGDEIGRLVLKRFYSEQVPRADWPRPLAMFRGWWEQEPPAFEFGAFMRETRLRVDTLLAAGRVADAEAYMEARRQVLVEKGYAIRKLNQAYFAFHGSYAVGASATDPIGGKLRALRHRSDSLAGFIQTVSGITSVAELDAALAATW